MKKGFTLIEIMIAVAIASVVLLSIFGVFNQNMQAWYHGEKKMVLQAELSRVLSYIYNDLKRVNPAIYYDQNFDLWVAGEKFKEAKPNEIELIDENTNVTDGFERIKFKVYLVEPFSKRETIEYYLQKDPNSVTPVYLKNKKGSAFVLIRSVDDRETIVSENVENIKFFKTPGDLKNLKVSAKITMPPEYDIKNRTDSFDLNVRFDNDHIVLREAISSKN